MDSYMEEQDIDSDMEEQPLAPAPFPQQVDWGNHNIWDWEAEDMKKWEPASLTWQDFMNYWVDPIRAADLHHNVFPYELQIFPSSRFPELTINKIGASPFLHTFDGKMLVLERYGFLYHSLKGAREEQYRGGVVLGGQSGVGKSLLLWYFLVRLIQDRQPVLLHLSAHNVPTILFYDGKAWCPKFDFRFQKIPHGPNNPTICRSRPIFVLVDSADTLPSGMPQTMGWPIYAVSPKPGRSKAFMKERSPLIWGLDLWTPDQLLDGLKLQLEWPMFVGDLSTLLQSGTANTRALRCVISLANEPRYKDWPKTTVEEWTKILLDNAIYWRGRIARDVFRIILQPKSTEPRIEGDISSNPLQDVASLLTRREFPLAYYDSYDPISHRTLALQMQPQSLTSDDNSMFTFVIKNLAMRAAMDDNIFWSDDSTIRSVFNSLRTLPSGSGSVLAGHIFAEYALSRMTMANLALPLKPMDFRSGTVAFTADKNARSEVPKDVYPHSYARPSLEFMQTKGLKRCAWQEPNYKYGSLEAGVLYVLTNQPLFDAFFLENIDSHSVLWILQFTTTREHRDAGKGLMNVRDLLKLAKRTIGEVHVHWVLVTPTSASDDNVSDREWQMPLAWNKYIQNNHCGYLWLQEIDMNSGRCDSRGVLSTTIRPQK